MRFHLIAFVGAFWLLTDAQSVFSKAPIHADSAQYVKPGAAIVMSHDYDGQTELGEYETLTVTLSHIYQTGNLSVELLSSQDIQISAFTPIRDRPLSNGSTLDIPIQLSGSKAGLNTISLETVYRHPAGHESRRVLSILVQIGDGAIEKMPISEPTQTKTISKKGLVGLSAIEVIE